METNPVIEVTAEQKTYLLSLSPIEIIDAYCEGTLRILEEEMGMPIQLNIHRHNWDCSKFCVSI